MSRTEAIPGIGFQTLLNKEVRRFLRVPGQTVVSPLITTTLYFLVFGFTVTTRAQSESGVSYARFIVPGLIMLGVVSNSFLNTSSSLFMAKLQGTIVDLLVAPLSYAEILSAFVLAAVVRGVLVGGAMWLVAGLFTSFEVVHPLWAILFVLLVATFFGTAGVLVAIWAEKFEQINLVPTFIITPLTFLGGVFYSVNRLPSIFQEVARANPILYMVEGLRYGILGISDTSPFIGLGMLLVINIIAISVAYHWLRTGYRLRS
jgi:ABC-2 type transport system permease protein